MVDFVNKADLKAAAIFEILLPSFDIQGELAIGVDQFDIANLSEATFGCSLAFRCHNSIWSESVFFAVRPRKNDQTL